LIEEEEKNKFSIHSSIQSIIMSTTAPNDGVVDASNTEAVNDPYLKYRKMLKTGIPRGAVDQAMLRDSGRSHIIILIPFLLLFLLLLSCILISILLLF
jgi:hypothetical protein